MFPQGTSHLFNFAVPQKAVLPIRILGAEPYLKEQNIKSGLSVSLSMFLLTVP